MVSIRTLFRWFHCRCISCSAIVSSRLHLQDYSNSIAQTSKSFLRCNFVERNIYSDTEAGYYISTLHCWKDACCATRKPEELPVIATGYILHVYALKLVLGGIYFSYTVLLDFICTLTISFWIQHILSIHEAFTKVYQ